MGKIHLPVAGVSFLLPNDWTDESTHVFVTPPSEWTEDEGGLFRPNITAVFMPYEDGEDLDGATRRYEQDFHGQVPGAEDLGKESMESKLGPVQLLSYRAKPPTIGTAVRMTIALAHADGGAVVFSYTEAPGANVGPDQLKKLLRTLGSQD
ncbi:MAG: hypothetical protein AAF654_08570 [Myxococcota bacterium]